LTESARRHLRNLMLWLNHPLGRKAYGNEAATESALKALDEVLAEPSPRPIKWHYDVVDVAGNIYYAKDYIQSFGQEWDVLAVLPVGNACQILYRVPAEQAGVS
jgi:hypothetical protein